MRLNSILIVVLAMCFALLATATPVRAADGYTYYSVGNVSAPTPDSRSLGMMLNGGADWSPKAWKWFVNKAGHGHILILRASGDGSDGHWIMDKIGGVASVETLKFDDRKAAFDPRVAKVLARADGIFIAGGDQSKYVRFWKDTPVSKALNALVADGKPVGGTSAGLAILGGAAYGALATEAIDTQEALANPNDPRATLVRDFLDMPYLDHVITDTHFTERGRLGRLIAFVAQSRVDGHPDTVGLGIDEDTALCVDGDGTGRLYTLSGGHAWLVQPEGAPTFMADKALDWKAVKLTGIGTGSTLDFKTLNVTDPAFEGIAKVRDGTLLDVPSPTKQNWTLAIHGGAGVIHRGDLTPEEDKAYRASLEKALAAGSAILRKGGSSVDAVEATLRVLEDNPLFNAGKGAVFDAVGKNQMDAAIMDGSTLNAGAVAGVSTTKNPILLARAVMDRSRHVLLSGAGADKFAREQNITQVDPGYFRTKKRWQQYLEWKQDNQASLDPTHRYGTVGAVALDREGHLAAATSTGGLTGKRWGRIGDSPILGAGTYAYDGRCAVSATGTGEYFIRESATRRVCDRVAWKKETIQQAADGTIKAIGDIGGDGGVVSIDGQGHVAFAMNTEGMYRGRVTDTEPAAVAIYADEVVGGP